MSETRSTNLPATLFLATGADCEGEQRSLGISTIAFKVTMPNPGDIFILENTFLTKGGPVRTPLYQIFRHPGDASRTQPPHYPVYLTTVACSRQ